MLWLRWANATGEGFPSWEWRCLTVIEELDVLRDLMPGLLPRGISPIMRQLILERVPEALYRRLIISVALATHGRDQAKLPQTLLIVLSASTLEADLDRLRILFGGIVENGRR